MSNRVIVRFASPPAMGTSIDYDGQVFAVAAVEPYVRVDGEPSQVITWAAQCLDCAATIEIKCGLPLRISHRRCEKHRHPGKRAQPAGGA